jgi:cysteinyl-tRNA synthetase
VSKSLGNFFTIGEILEQAAPLALREYFLGSHYRSPMEFSPEKIKRLNSGGKTVEPDCRALDRNFARAASKS